MFDMVTVGETMLRFTPKSGLLWEQADEFQMHIGGSESNTAIGLARLGHCVAWVSRLTNNSFGKKISNSIAQHGVDVKHVVWTDQDRIGVYYYEEGSPPRGNRVLYDRANSSFSRFAASELPAGLFAPGQAKFLHVTGISLGLGETSRRLIQSCIELAKAAHWKVSFDLNYRAKLWSTDEARRVCEPLFEQADIVFLPIRDARLVWNLSYDSSRLDEEPRQVAADVTSEFLNYAPNSIVVMTLGSLGAAARSRSGFAMSETSRVPEVGRLGGGDAFSAGFLSGTIRGKSLEESLRWGNAAAQLKYSTPGDIPYFDQSQVEAIVNKSAATPFR